MLKQHKTMRQQPERLKVPSSLRIRLSIIMSDEQREHRTEKRADAHDVGLDRPSRVSSKGPICGRDHFDEPGMYRTILDGRQSGGCFCLGLV